MSAKPPQSQAQNSLSKEVWKDWEASDFLDILFDAGASGVHSVDLKNRLNGTSPSTLLNDLRKPTGADERKRIAARIDELKKQHKDGKYYLY